MKNKTAFVASLLILLTIVLGCSSLNPLGSKSKPANGTDPNSPSSGETSPSGDADGPVVVEKTGVQECDELIDFIAAQSKSKDDNFASKAMREFAFNRVREALRKSIEEEKGKPEELAKKCAEFKTQLETFKSREDVQKENQ